MCLLFYHPLSKKYPLCVQNKLTTSKIWSKRKIDAVLYVHGKGEQYAESGAIDGKLPEETGSPMSPEEQYVKIVNGN